MVVVPVAGPDMLPVQVTVAAMVPVMVMAAVPAMAMVMAMVMVLATVPVMVRATVLVMVPVMVTDPAIIVKASSEHRNKRTEAREVDNRPVERLSLLAIYVWTMLQQRVQQFSEGMW